MRIRRRFICWTAGLSVLWLGTAPVIGEGPRACYADLAPDCLQKNKHNIEDTISERVAWLQSLSTHLSFAYSLCTCTFTLLTPCSFLASLNFRLKALAWLKRGMCWCALRICLVLFYWREIISQDLNPLGALVCQIVMRLQAVLCCISVWCTRIPLKDTL